MLFPNIISLFPEILDLRCLTIIMTYLRLWHFMCKWFFVLTDKTEVGKRLSHIIFCLNCVPLPIEIRRIEVLALLLNCGWNCWIGTSSHLLSMQLKWAIEISHIFLARRWSLRRGNVTFSGPMTHCQGRPIEKRDQARIEHCLVLIFRRFFL